VISAEVRNRELFGDVRDQYVFVADVIGVVLFLSAWMRRSSWYLSSPLSFSRKEEKDQVALSFESATSAATCRTSMLALSASVSTIVSK
jgi:hypothetical protein